MTTTEANHMQANLWKRDCQTEADMQAQYGTSLCDRYGIPCKVAQANEQYIRSVEGFYQEYGGERSIFAHKLREMKRRRDYLYEFLQEEETELEESAEIARQAWKKTIYHQRNADGFRDDIQKIDAEIAILNQQVVAHG